MASVTSNGGRPGDDQELERLLAGYDTALLTTRGPDGHFHTRPMAMQKHRASSRELWFVTSLESTKVHDLESDAQCAIALYSGQHSATYVSISGSAEIVRDRQMIHRLWEPGWRAWFPQGADEPDIALIHFRAEHAEYVHPVTGRLQVLFTMVRNIVTRNRAEPAAKKELDWQH